MMRIEHDEHLFRLLVQRVYDYAIFMIDPKGLVMSWNEGAQALKGYQAHEIIGQSFGASITQKISETTGPRSCLRSQPPGGEWKMKAGVFAKTGAGFGRM